MDFTEVLKNNFALYPKSSIKDLFKLAYQCAFGCGHLVSDIERAREYFYLEYDNVCASTDYPLFEQIGEFSRVNLSTAKYFKINAERIFRAFVASSQNEISANEAKDSFKRCVKCIRDAIKDNLYSLSLEEFDDFYSDYMHLVEKEGYAPFSHSDGYKKEYFPSYRVIDSKYIRLFPLIEKIDSALEEKQQVVIAIDGRAASGKSTAANLLSMLYDSSVISMDDFFLPIEKRTEQRYKMHGANIDYERFNAEVVAGIKSGREFEYGIFDCSQMKIIGKEKCLKSKVILVEGVYSLTPFIEDIYDIKVFVDVSFEEQAKRLKKRSSKEIFDKFIKIWLPLEENYFLNCNVKNRCDMEIK